MTTLNRVIKIEEKLNGGKGRPLAVIRNLTPQQLSQNELWAVFWNCEPWKVKRAPTNEELDQAMEKYVPGYTAMGLKMQEEIYRNLYQQLHGNNYNPDKSASK
jgi:hypothetical protein